MKTIIPILLVFVLVLSCNVDDSDILDVLDDEEGTAALGTLRATVNGNSFTADNEDDFSGVNGSLLSFGDGFLFFVGGSRIIGLDGLEVVSFGVGGVDVNFDEITSGFEVDLNNSFGYLIEGSYTNTELLTNLNGSLNLDDAYIKITAIDKELKTVSGEFRFSGTEGDTGAMFTVANGVFEDVVYDVTD